MGRRRARRHRRPLLERQRDRAERRPRRRARRRGGGGERAPRGRHHRAARSSARRPRGARARRRADHARSRRGADGAGARRAGAAAGARRGTPGDRALVARWRTAYMVELSGSAPGPATDADALAWFDGVLAEDVLWIAEADGAPAAITAFNAQLPDCVQVGGVYTPPE